MRVAIISASCSSASVYRVPRGAPALGRAAGVEDLKAVGRALEQRNVRVTENDRVGSWKPAAQPRQPAAGGAGVVHDRDRHARHLHHGPRRQGRPHVRIIDVAVDSGHRTVGLKLAQHRERDEVAAMQDERCRPEVARCMRPAAAGARGAGECPR